jgi:uncharacterized membrane protein HdeD (DUF308 family)
MKKFFKSLKPGLLLTGLLSLVLGIVLIVNPGIVESALRFILGGGLALFGLFEVVSVFVRPNGLMSVGRMIPGILCLAVGLVFLFRFDTFVSLLWILIGIAILIDSVYKLQYAFTLKATKVKTWWINLLVALAAMIFATVLMIEPFGAANSMAMLTGILLSVNGLFDLVSLGVLVAGAEKGKSVVTVEIRDAEDEKSLTQK